MEFKEIDIDMKTIEELQDDLLNSYEKIIFELTTANKQEFIRTKEFVLFLKKNFEQIPDTGSIHHTTLLETITGLLDIIDTMITLNETVYDNTETIAEKRKGSGKDETEE